MLQALLTRIGAKPGRLWARASSFKLSDRMGLTKRTIATEDNLVGSHREEGLKILKVRQLVRKLVERTNVNIGWDPSLQSVIGACQYRTKDKRYRKVPLAPERQEALSMRQSGADLQDLEGAR